MVRTPVAAILWSTFLAPLDPASRSEIVVGRLTDAIHVGLLEPGVQLPSELELAAQLSVSTITVREALATLREQGVVETRRGRGGGTFVRAQTPVDRADLRLRLRQLTTDVLLDIGDHGAAISEMAARLSASRASTSDLRRLRGHVETLASAAAAGDLKSCERADVRFHIELAASSYSPRIARQVSTFQAEVSPLVWMQPQPSDIQEHLERHERILAAISSRDEIGAARLMLDHVRQITGSLTRAHLALLTDNERLSDGGAPGDSLARAGELLTSIEDALEPSFEEVEKLRDQILIAYASARTAGRGLRRADLVELGVATGPLLTTELSIVAGAGFAFAPGALEDSTTWLEWWSRAEDGHARATRAILDPAEPEFYDYVSAEWYARPEAFTKRMMTGPAVEYNDTQRHIITLTSPIVSGETFLGLAAADVLLGELERLIGPRLAELSLPAAVVSDEGRVVLANSEDFPIISLLDFQLPDASEQERHEWITQDRHVIARSSRLPWSVVLRLER